MMRIQPPERQQDQSPGTTVYCSYDALRECSFSPPREVRRRFRECPVDIHAGERAQMILSRPGRNNRMRGIKAISTQSAQPQNVLHVINTGLALHQPARRAQRASGKGHARFGAVRDLHALTATGKENGMIADDIAGTDTGEADGLARTLAADAVPAVHAMLLEITLQYLGNDLTHAQRRARRRIRLVAVMRLDDFHVHIIAQHTRGGLEQLETEIHAHAHVGREYNRDVPGGAGDAAFPRIIETCSPDDHFLSALAAVIEVGECRFRAGEIHQHVKIQPVETGTYRHAELAHAGHLAPAPADGPAAGALNGGAQAQALGASAGFDERPAHAPGGAGDGDIDHLASLSGILLPERIDDLTGRRQPITTAHTGVLATPRGREPRN